PGNDNLPLAPPDQFRVEAADWPAGGKKKGGAPERRHAAERDDERWHLESGYGHALQETAEESDSDSRDDRESPAVAEGVLALADAEPVGEAALGDRRRDKPGEGDERADGKVDAGCKDDERHADCQQSVNRHLAEHVEEVERREERRLGNRKDC